MLPIQLPIEVPSALASILAETDWRDWFLIGLTPLFVLVVALEWWRFRKTRIYDWRDSLASMNLGGAYMLVDVLWVVAVILPAMDWVYAHRLTTIEVTPLSFVALYLGVEFCYYWFHRASHRIRWFWAAHVVHHASEHMNFTTAMRQSWLYSFAGNWLFYVPMAWIGFDPRWVLFALSANLAYQFFIHTQWVDRLPAWVEGVFNTPSHHRAHHGRNPQYIDHNYGGTLIVFDRLFGTFVEEDAPVEYGIVRQVHSHNVLWLTVHEWVDMIRDVLQPGPLATRLKHIWAPPEWTRTPDNCAHASSSPPRPDQHSAA
ncbi:sterol desaturase family protein [Aquabacterium sp.]|uniref:sterol desaturase family protein n=1 Tax=Aquabacterium sp. TaxID=1872578 RepID=UPI002E33CA25|nr:sterol desaturase family protein [Aquabacterium sp.]HEX5312978.1 sterol desaturase family protein [Aquabacterium sp.]